ncbi:MAG: carboxymuconolactone decarboxylase family protein [Planctomycetota bacterium]|jgi:AhpD family alkylhydroperoxidase
MSAQEFFDKYKESMEKMRTQSRATVTGFAGLFSKTMAEGVLAVKEKELVAVGIAVASQCEPCIKLHVKKCLEIGASREEILEACGVAVMMGGGPAYTHVPMVIETMDELES